MGRSSSHEGCGEIRSSREALRRLRAAVPLAEEVGSGLARGEILQRGLPLRTPCSTAPTASGIAAAGEVITPGVNVLRRHATPDFLAPALTRREHRRMKRWRPGEVEEVFCRSSGPGGQNVNKVSTAVTLRHIPTGLTVRVSGSRSQAANRREAARLLMAKLDAAAAARRQEKLADLAKKRRQIAKRSKSTQRRLVESKRRRSQVKQQRSGRLLD